MASKQGNDHQNYGHPPRKDDYFWHKIKKPETMVPLVGVIVSVIFSVGFVYSNILNNQAVANDRISALEKTVAAAEQERQQDKQDDRKEWDHIDRELTRIAAHLGLDDNGIPLKR